MTTELSEPAGEEPIALEGSTRSNLVRTAGRWFLGLLIVGATIQPLSWLFSAYSWTADLFCHFREPGLAMSLVAMLAAARLGSRGMALGFVAIASLQAYGLTGYGGDPPVRPSSSNRTRPVRLLMANVLFENRELQDLADLIEREQPDIVGLVEFTTECGEALRSARSKYPFRSEVPTGASGLALWFRNQPIALDRAEYPLEGRNPVIHAVFSHEDGPRHLWLVHPTSPLWRKFEPGNPELAALARVVGSGTESRIVMGDFNSTDASAHFRAFVRATGLRDSRLGFGRQPSWPSMLHYRIAIDHAFVSSDLAVINRRLGPMIGSDHLPVLFEVAPAERPGVSSTTTRTSPSATASQSIPSP
ncbi:MAG: endonuclease/exonuclease/phosphatase family protein [Isosphaeraceae bacterium]